MATYSLPNSNGQIRQLGMGDRFGELWSSKNIDLSSSPGKIKLSLPVQSVMDATDLTNDAIVAIELYKDNIYVLTANTLYRDDTPYNNFASVSTTPSNAADMVVFDGEIRIVDNTNVDRYDGTTYNTDWWTGTISGTALSSSYPHVAEVVRNSGKDTIAITDGSRLRYYNSTAGHTSFTWDSDVIACCQTQGLNLGWIGTYSESSQGAQVISWAVGDSQYRQAYPVDGHAVLAMCVYNNIPYLITERGEIHKFNQAGFTAVGTIPMWRKPEFLTGVETGLIQSYALARPVHPKGMRVVGNKIWIYIDTNSSERGENVNERCPAGIWEFDPQTGSTTHRYSIGFDTKLGQCGPLFTINDPQARFYFGARRDNLDGTGEEHLYREDLTGSDNYGYLVTTEMHSESFEENFNNVYIGSLKDSNDKIVVKYRTSQSLTLPIQSDVTWASTTQFNTTTDLSDVSVGDEVEVLTDAGAGRCAHITKIDQSSSTYSVTVDEAIGTENSPASVQFDNWSKLDTYDTTELIKRIGINETNTSIQLKFYMEGDSGYPEISRMVVKSNNKKQLK